jgi:hypothetical protein
MVDAVKPSLLSSITISPQKASGSPANAGNFADFFKTDMKQFIHKAHEVEGMLTNYVGGVGDVEAIAPKFKELMLDFEVKTKIISSLANILKTLTSMNI